MATEFAGEVPVSTRLVAAGRMLAVALLLAVSPLMLYMLGWQYFDTGGSPIEKFHPAVLLSAGVLLFMASANGNPLTGLIALFERTPVMIPFFAANAFMMAYVSLVLKLPVTIFIETFIGAALVSLLFQDLPEQEGRRLALLVHALIFADVALGFYEQFSGGWHLTPLIINGEDLSDEPRSTALLGHPLANACLVGVYVVMLAVGGARDLPLWLRPVCFLAALASLVPFGGRAATALTLLCLAYLGVGRIWAILRGATFDSRAILAGLIIVPLAALGLVTGFEMGLFDTLTNRLIDDEGSAGTRIEMFALFRYLSLEDLLFGPDPATLMTWVRLHGLEYGIESFVVAFILNYGLLCTVIFFPPLALFFYHLKQSCRPGAGLAIFHFLAVSLTSISLSSKSPTLSVFVVLLSVLLRRGDTLVETSGRD
jgi:hypothetical protein